MNLTRMVSTTWPYLMLLPGAKSWGGACPTSVGRGGSSITSPRTSGGTISGPGGGRCSSNSWGSSDGRGSRIAGVSSVSNSRGGGVGSDGGWGSDSNGARDRLQVDVGLGLGVNLASGIVDIGLGLESSIARGVVDVGLSLGSGVA